MRKDENKALRVFYDGADEKLRKGWAGQIIADYLERVAKNENKTDRQQFC